MKKIYYIFSIALLFFCSCERIEEPDNVIVGADQVIISTSTASSVVTRSADTSPEERVDWIDIFIFDENNALHHYERIDKQSAPDYGSGQFVIQKKRQDFEVNKKYFVFLVANSNANFRNVAALGDLQRVIQSDPNLHLSGLGYADSPELFLMDGVAYIGDEEPAMPMTMVLNDGDLTASTNLKATLRRAAAKLIVNIVEGENVEFKTRLEVKDENGSVVNAGDASYSFYQLPIGTSVIAPIGGMGMYNNIKQTTDDRGNNNDTFVWSADNKIAITGYAYANDWSSTEMTKETSLILNLPMYWDKNADLADGKEDARPNSWFKVPLSKESKFERNKCYIVNIKINAIGAESKSSAIELDDIEYITSDWIYNKVNVGTNENAPQYLMLNRDTVRIYNSNFDSELLTFSSSSPIKSITLKSIDGDNYSAYYYNKYNAKIELSAAIKNTISATAESNVLNGNISIISPIVPSDQKEIEEAIAALGEMPVPPTMPDITEPQEPDGKPVEPEMPDPNDYVPESEDRPNNPSDGDTYTVYRYSNGEFQQMTYTYNRFFLGGGWWDAGQWTTIQDPVGYTAAMNKYQDEKEAYDSALAEWQNTSEYKQYLTDLEAYKNDPSLKTYHELYTLYEANIQEYNNAVAAINATSNASETHYNTIRYVEFEVENTDGLTATFVVEQYPTIYITNSVGWYSYRDDFKNTSEHATSYHIKGDRISSIDYTRGVYSLTVGNPGGYSFWYSRRSGSPEPDHEGTATTSVYYWDNANSNSTTDYSSSTGQNTRMYHIRVSSTSDSYTVGVPKRVTITKEINYSGTNRTVTYETTESSESNARLVSPSFMTASRLGVLTTDGITYSDSNSNDEKYEVFSYHCANYVEVKQVIVNGETKKVVYDDWRLPTAAEIGFIIGVQSTNSSDMTAAIDYLLNAGYYFSASGPVKNNNSATSVSVRCVRDAVYEPEPIGLTE